MREVEVSEEENGEEKHCKRFSIFTEKKIRKRFFFFKLLLLCFPLYGFWNPMSAVPCSWPQSLEIRHSSLSPASGSLVARGQQNKNEVYLTKKKTTWLRRQLCKIVDWTKIYMSTTKKKKENILWPFAQTETSREQRARKKSSLLDKELLPPHCSSTQSPAWHPLCLISGQ